MSATSRSLACMPQQSDSADVLEASMAARTSGHYRQGEVSKVGNSVWGVGQLRADGCEVTRQVPVRESAFKHVFKAGMRHAESKD